MVDVADETPRHGLIRTATPGSVIPQREVIPTVTAASIVLVGQSPELAGLRWQSPQRLHIGRFASDVEVVLNDPSISPHHAEVLQTRIGWVVRDLGSRHGTFVNCQSVNGRQVPLTNQDKLQLGRLQLEVLLEQSEPAAPPEGQAAPPIAAPPAPE